MQSNMPFWILVLDGNNFHERRIVTLENGTKKVALGLFRLLMTIHMTMTLNDIDY